MISYSDRTIQVPLSFKNCVIASATLNDKKATLLTKVLATSAHPQYYVELHQKGNYLLTLTFFIKLNRLGNWQFINAQIPSCPASVLNIHVPQANTELHLDHLSDNHTILSRQTAQVIKTVPGKNGILKFQWRSVNLATKADNVLTAKTSALVDILEGRVRVYWENKLTFSKQKRSQFSFTIPKQYIVEKVSVPNIQTWHLEAKKNYSVLHVKLLKPVKDHVSINIHLLKNYSFNSKESYLFTLIQIKVNNAVRQTGKIIIRNSQALNLHTTSTVDINQINIRKQDLQLFPNDLDINVVNPSGLTLFQAYQYYFPNYHVSMQATPIKTHLSTNMQAILRIGQNNWSIESKLNLAIKGKALYQLSFLLPENFQLKKSMVTKFRWI